MSRLYFHNNSHFFQIHSAEQTHAAFIDFIYIWSKNNSFFGIKIIVKIVKIEMWCCSKTPVFAMSVVAFIDISDVILLSCNFS